MLKPEGVSPFSRPPAVRLGDLLVGRSVFLILLAIFTASMPSQPSVLDGEVEFQTTSALAREGTHAIGGTPEAEALIAESLRRQSNGQPPFNLMQGEGDAWYSWFGVGQAYLGVPFYLAGSLVSPLFPEIDEAHSEVAHQGVHRTEFFEHLAVAWRNPLLSALTGLLVVLTSRRLGASRKNAWLAGLTYGLCTFAWPQARSTLNMVQATFFLFLSFHLIVVVEERLFRYRRPGTWPLVLCGLSLGAAFLTRSLTAPVLVVLGIALLFVLWRGSKHHGERVRFLDLVLFAAPALALFGVFLWSNQLRFGDPLEQGYSEAVSFEGYFNYPVHHGLAGLLLSPGRGLLWLAPGVLLFLPWAWRQLKLRELRVPLLVLGVAAAVLVPVSMTVGWHGAWCYGPRYALPLLPFLWLAVGPMLDRLADDTRWRPAAWLLLGFGTLTSVPGVLVDTTTHTALAVEAARIEWPDLEGGAETQEEERFQRILWDLRFAPPWAHWRMLRHRIAIEDEEFPLTTLFFVTDDRTGIEEEQRVATLSPTEARDRGFAHNAWVDFAQRIGAPIWPIVILCLLLFFGGCLLALKGLDPDQA